MAATAKISISVADRGLLEWARQRSKRTGLSLSAVFTEAARAERQMEAREAYLRESGPEDRATPEEMAAIRAEWGDAPAVSREPRRSRRAAARPRRRAR